MSATSPISGPSPATSIPATRTGSWSRPSRSTNPRRPARLMEGGSRPGFDLLPVAFADIPGWADDDHAAALAAFRRAAAVLAEHPPKRRLIGLDPEALAASIRRAAALPADISRDGARTFFEANFVAREVRPKDGPAFYTGYYEPIVAGSRRPSAEFRTPLYAPPADLVEIDPDN